MIKELNSDICTQSKKKKNIFFSFQIISSTQNVWRVPIFTKLPANWYTLLKPIDVNLFYFEIFSISTQFQVKKKTSLATLFDATRTDKDVDK